MTNTNLRRAFLVLFTIVTCSHAAIAQALEEARVAHYSQIAFRESPFADLRGAYPITAELAKTYKHYRFVYDQHDRVIEVSFRHGDNIHNPNISANALFFTSVIRVEYDGNKERRTFFDRFMNPINANGAFQEEYDLDADGNRIALRFYNAEGNWINNGWGIAQYEWRIDSRGTVTENRFDLQGEAISIRPGFPFYCLKLHYDQRGLLSMMENYGKRCDGLIDNTMNAAQDRLQYNAQGGLYAWNVYNAQEERSIGNGPMVARGIIVRDGRGHSIGEYYQDPDGQMMLSAYGWTDTKAVFDEHGNMVRRYNLDVNGQPANNPITGYSGYDIEFDEVGRFRELLRYWDASGRPASHMTRGYHAVRTERDDSGNVTRISFLDAAGHMVNRTDSCVARIDREYDAQNHLVSEQQFDADGQLVETCKGS